MKILYHHRIASKDGQYVHIEAITTELLNLGHELIMVAPSVAENNDFGSDGGWVSKVRQFMPKFISELLELAYSVLAFLKLSIAIMKHRPDVIYERYNLYLPAGIWAKKLFKLPLLLEVNSPLYLERDEYGGVALPRLAKWTERYAWQHADKVLPVSNVLASYVKAEGVPDDKIVVIPNGVNLDLFKPKERKNRKPEFDNKLVVGFVGFCREWHKLDEVLITLNQHENKSLFFLVVGDGPAIPELRKLAKELGFEDRFHVTGLVERDAMPFWLDQIDIALQSSVTPWASPLKMLEYMAKGLTILAPKAPNIEELITHEETALLFSPDDLQSFTATLNTLCGDETLCKTLGERAQKKIYENDMTWNGNARLIIKLFEQLKA
ncbi:MAG: glycosyltransferase family 4 protein [Pseudomonadota bacterium]|nr:glycosyltransferase family 4 protein [Pseudomonadota bacterium]